MKDYYAILGVKPDAPPAQIKKAFRRLAKDYHPDVTGGDKAKESRFKDISQAYDTVGDAKKRAEYDRQREEAAAGPRFRQAPGGVGADFDLDDLLGRMHGGRVPFGGGRSRRGGGRDVFSDIFEGRGEGFEEVFPDGAQSREEPSDVYADLEVDFIDAAKGGTRTVAIDVRRACPECGGLGGQVERCTVCAGSGMRRTAAGPGIEVAQTCPRCGGSGQTVSRTCPRCEGRRVVQAQDTLQVRIPAGVDDGSVIRLRGRGPAAPTRRRSGATSAADLLLRVKVRPHPRFRREGADVSIDLPLTIEEAILGAQVEVPTVDGPARLHVPAGSSSGQRLRLRGKGAHRLGGEGRGDQYVRIEIVVPQKVDAQTVELVRELNRRAPVKVER